MIQKKIFKTATMILPIFITIFICLLLYFRSIQPDFTFIPTYSYIPFYGDEQELQINFVAFCNKSFDPEKEKPMIELGNDHLEISEVKYEVSKVDFIKNSVQITATCIPKNIKTPYIANNLFLQFDNIRNEYYIGRYVFDFQYTFHNNKHLNPNYGERKTIIEDEDEAKMLKEQGFSIVQINENTFELSSIVGRAGASSLKKLPYAVTPLVENVYLKKIIYGIDDYYEISPEKRSLYVDEASINIPDVFLAYIYPVIQYDWNGTSKYVVAPRVFLGYNIQLTNELYKNCLEESEKYFSKGY